MIFEIRGAPENNLISFDSIKSALESEYIEPDIDHFRLSIFEYKRVGSVAKAAVFGFIVFKRVGDISSLFGVNWIGDTTARIH